MADGTYRASSVAYNGSLEVEVNVRQGRLTGVRVTSHREKQFYEPGLSLIRERDEIFAVLRYTF